ncbi:MurR/RpiR family transcriptional regulator [Streptomyces zingiberis]|uniref:MurR/RpiR family transcriptional regulator n=1 Tax=Streptomyces zingiberis TaxID=2053010 RepID=A0ABX1BS04_9ACTN|nr:MurR/RpiR family transcriptional regulator [Streptomyces zingiberis]NJQ00481.1 MurR/RpiR family transcriptional regulator [Streptomyces zingiberis]
MEDSSTGRTLLERVTAATGHLSPQERRVAEYMLANPQQVAASSAADVAKLARASDATVIRTAQSLGYAGFSELRKSLILGSSRRTAADILEDRIAHAGGENDLAIAVRDSVDVIGMLGTDRVGDAWDAAFTLLASSERVWTLGFGPAGSLADFLALSLVRIGLEATAMTTTGFRLADDLLRFRRGDVLVVFAPVRLFREIDAALAHARETGVGTVVVTEALGMVLDGKADVVLSTPETTHNSASELTAGLVLAHSLVLHLAKANRGESRGRMDDLNRLRTRIAGPALDAS